MAAVLADDIFKCIFLNENDRIPIQISLKYVQGVQLTLTAETGTINVKFHCETHNIAICID